MDDDHTFMPNLPNQTSERRGYDVDGLLYIRLRKVGNS